jgi:hypothetical protein
MNKITILLISVFITCGCEKKIDFTYRPSEKQKLANKIRKESAIQLKNELGLIPCGSGGQMMGQIQMLALSFDYREPIDIETGRELLIAAVEKFAAEINSNEAIRPYLENYPFGPKNIEIEIYIQDRNGKDFGPKKLSIITARKGLLRYKIHTPDNCALETVHEETFEEAIKRVNSR